MAVSPLILTAAVMGIFLLVIAFWLDYRVADRSYSVLGLDRIETPDTALDDVSVYGEGSEVEQQEKPSGLIRWLTTVDHKDIGLMYGVYALVAFVWGGIGIVIMRAELVTPTEAIIDASLYNALLTSHGITMLFLFGTPIIAAFANYFIPLLIGADDMAFPRINAIAFWLLPPGAVLIWGGFLIPGVTAAQTSWTMYTPLSVEQPQAGADMLLLGLHLTGVSATMGAINFIATIITERGEDVSWADLDLFSWTMLTQSAIILFAFPLLGSALIMLLLDRNFGTAFFAVDGGGGPILWQHLFWFFGHPEVYILVLPPMGLISYILPRFSGRRLFGFKFVVYSTLAIGVLSFGVWAHHMFSTGINPELQVSFMAISLAIAIPSAVKVFNWITTMWSGRLRLTTPMLFCIGFISNFILGGVTGVFLAAVPVNRLVHDTYYVVGHFHYIVMGAIGFAAFAGIYYWFPIFTGRMYQRTLGKWHFWFSMVGTNVAFFAMLLLGYVGMPRRYAGYEVGVAPQQLLTNLHRAATLGALLLLIGQIIFVWNVVQSWLEGPEVDPDPWNVKEKSPALYGREYDWHEQRLETAIADGGEESSDDEPGPEPPANEPGADETRSPDDD
ncbi:cytochrome c oxidase subunit I [Halorientalis salina]|uniref:cytochrome c oxidase subunit I n=1 Tax=Halorientalis salina TaxID=2932266 RepID=UPI002022B5DF|nr:cytochrome c oxidase subunit I [Halorientalis salina]